MFVCGLPNGISHVTRMSHDDGMIACVFPFSGDMHDGETC